MARQKKPEGGKPIESYEHRDKERINNPPVGLVTPETDSDSGQKKKTYMYDPHLDPRLEWAGKAEHLSFEVPTVSLHVHERIDPRTIIESVRRKQDGEASNQLSLFAEERKEPLRSAVEFYRHKHGWTNRLIAGDSLLVMNSLLEKEGMAGKIQMIYIDPPYGIKYGSNFQPFVNKRDVKDGKDDDLTSEPEQIRAFRDTWELGIHSYLTYLRDRLLLARELLTESGSVFVQISDENVHHVRELMDEVFGVNNAVQIVPFRKKLMPLGAKLLEGMCDYLLWYAKDKTLAKYRALYQPTLPRASARWTNVQLPDGTRRSLTTEETRNLDTLPAGTLVYRLVSQRAPSFSQASVYTFQFKGSAFEPPRGGCWVTTPEKMHRLANSDRIDSEGDNLSYVYFHADFPYARLNNMWDDTAPVQGKTYVVQTTDLVLERCLLMTTDPGDLVLDPTCGSGTTAYVAEQWGRRWITCDTSRVALTLAKQRLMTAVFDYYELAHPEEGVGSGFKYKTVPHITLKSIANNPEIDGIHEKWQKKLEPLREHLNALLKQSWKEWEIPREAADSWPQEAVNTHAEWWTLRRKRQEEIDAAIARHAPQETLYDQPFVDKKKLRVSGPFTVEAVPAPAVKSPDEVLEPESQPSDLSIVRSGETLRQGEWRDELLRTGIRGKGGKNIEFIRLEPLPGLRWLHADGENKDEKSDRVVVSFGPEHAPLEQRQVAQAIDEAQKLVPKPKIVVFAAFQFDPEAAKDIDETNWPGVTLLKAQMNADLLTDDLKKKRSSNESFWLIGQPDVHIERIAKGEDKGKFVVSVHGFDYYNPKTGQIESGGQEKIAVWLLDTDYDGRSLYPHQVFFPMAGENEGWAKLAKNLKAEIDQDLIEAFRGTVSLPFKLGENKKIAVKIVDDRGIESLKILEVD
ncbi:MAG: site-specific DNA-methyltransferase [Synergistales bacterium]